MRAAQEYLRKEQGEELHFCLVFAKYSKEWSEALGADRPLLLGVSQSCSGPEQKAFMSWLSRLAERQIQKARLQGQFQDLLGKGKSLPDQPGDAFVVPVTRLGFASWQRRAFCRKRLR